MLSVSELAPPGLDPVSFDLADGECLALRGPSGSGKTLLLRALADLDPNHGSAMLDGKSREDFPAPHWRRLVTYVQTEPGWWANRVGEHFPDWPTAGPLVAELGLPGTCHDWPIAQLSTGERQRLGLVRALVLRPRVLLLDEPSSGLDPDATGAVERIVKECLAEGTSALWATHDAGQARRIATRCLVIDGGRAKEAPP
ncbi:MAG: ATP-binding cassette domain-containing protein [Alphaproteobacteria bacterium]